jgi:hypothetical protein
MPSQGGKEKGLLKAYFIRTLISLGRTLFLVADCQLLVSSHDRKQARSFSGVSFISTSIPFMRVEYS